MPPFSGTSMQRFKLSLSWHQFPLFVTPPTSFTNPTLSVPPIVFFMHPPCCTSTLSMVISSAGSVVSTPIVITIGTTLMPLCNKLAFARRLPACPLMSFSHAANVPALKEFLSKELTSASKSEMCARNQYNNHPVVTQNVPAVMRKFAAEEEKTFHLHLPRSFVFFIEGLMLNPLQWVVRKGKGLHLCGLHKCYLVE